MTKSSTANASGDWNSSGQPILDNLERSLRKSAIDQSNVLERALSFLATTGNTAPFIGLFGTVWGIMQSFRGIGLKGSASLAVVAPGISEALIATAAGLAAAIPAVVAFNYFNRKAMVLQSEMDTFASDFLSLVGRRVFKGEVMPEEFDAYYRWLGIPPKDQPANHYRLLGIELFEANADVIEAAADRQMTHLRTYQTGRHGPLSQKLLNEVAAAKIRASKLADTIAERFYDIAALDDW